MHGEAYAEHASPLEPAFDHTFRRRNLQVDAPHDCKAVRMTISSGEDDVVARSFPRRRYEERAVDARIVHFF